MEYALIVLATFVCAFCNAALANLKEWELHPVGKIWTQSSSGTMFSGLICLLTSSECFASLTFVA